MSRTLTESPAPARKTSKSDVLRPAAWYLPDGALALPITTCRMDVASHGRVMAWTRRKLRRENENVTLILRGLHELVAYFVPEATFITVRSANDDGPACLTLYFAGRRKGDGGLKGRLLPALVRWLAINFDKEPAADRMDVAKAMLAETVWAEIDVPADWGWNKGMTCPKPEHKELWNALTAHAIAALSGKRISFRSKGEDRWLVPTRPGPSGKTFDGVELVAFPPTRGGDGGFHSEVVTVTTATYPERGGIHLIVRVSMRSWGKPEGWRTDLGRTLDVFMPALGGTGDYESWRHSAFECERRRPEPGRPKGEEHWVWRHDQSRQVMGVLASLAGLEGISEDAPVAPMESKGSYAILPRLGTVHGDDNLSGGAGLGWADRHDFLLAISPHLEGLGLVPGEAMTRIGRRGLNPKVVDIFGNASRPKDPLRPKELGPDASESDLREHAKRLDKYEHSFREYAGKQQRFEADAAAKAVKRRASLRKLLGDAAQEGEAFRTFKAPNGEWDFETLAPAAPADPESTEEAFTPPAFLRREPEARESASSDPEPTESDPATAATVESKREAAPTGKRAAIEAAARGSNLPVPPDFSAPAHARFRAKLAKLVELAQAGDAEGLKAIALNPVSTSPRAMARYRDLAVLAIEAQRGA